MYIDKKDVRNLILAGNSN